MRIEEKYFCVGLSPAGNWEVIVHMRVLENGRFKKMRYLKAPKHTIWSQNTEELTFKMKICQLTDEEMEIMTKNTSYQ